VPDSAAVSGDVNQGGVVGVEDDAVAPFEVVALDASPAHAAVGGTIGSSVKTADIERLGMARVDGQVVDVLRFCEEGLPRLAAVVGGIDAAVPVSICFLLSPCGEVEALRIARIDLEAGGAGDACWQIDELPVIRLVRRALERSGSGHRAVFGLAAARDDEVERSVLRESDAPCKWFFACNPIVLFGPASTVVSGFVDSAAKGAGVESSMAGGAGGIEKDVGDGVYWNARGAWLPVVAAIS